MGYPLRPKNLKKSGFNDDNIAALRDLQRRVSALTEGQPNTDGVGALTWDEDRGTYNIAGTGETSFKIGEDLVYYAKNTSGSTIPIGSSVMFTGAVGSSGLLTFGLAVADGSVDPDYMMGITQQEIPHNGFGYVKHFGLLRGFRTDGVPQGETWSDGDLLYFDAATPGSLTKVKPVSPAVHEPIAVVVTASSGNSGSIFVRMKVSESLATLRDVYVNGSLTNGDVLIYDVTQDRFEANTLTAGANITITNGPGSITISSAGGVETDPIFTASAAFGITSGDISNWNTAYGWGNHALAGYLTSYTETDPTVPAHVKSITTTNISNWNTAYGWGDHATAGYQAAATALTTSTTFGGDVSGTYNAIVVADDSHNHIISNVDGLQNALDLRVDVSSGIASNLDTFYGAEMFGWSPSTSGTTPSSTYGQGIAIVSNGPAHNNASNWITQLAFGTDNNTAYFRGKTNSGGWGSWKQIFHDGYHPNADTLTTARTISLTGDVSGSTSFNGSANVSITATVADDSHNHIISNVDGLQTALDAKAPTVSPTFTGTITAAALNMGNGNITNVNHIIINDPGVGEGIQWAGGNGWQIYESPNGLTNAAGNLQFVTGSTRRATIDTNGNVFGISSVRAPIFFDSDNTGYYVDPASTGSAIVVNGYMLGGLGARTTGGTLDWNDVNNVRSGSTKTLLLGSATNGMGGGTYYHPLNFEYSSKNGSGNVTQMAIAYGSPGNRLWMRGRYSGSWSSWVEFLSTSADFQTKSGHLQSNSSLRAPIFYDSQNTGYYVDPTGTSVLNGADFDGIVKITTGSVGPANTTDGLMFDGNYTNGQYRHRFRKRDDSGGIPLYLDYAAGTANSYTELMKFGPNTADGSYLTVYGIISSNTDIRAPLFYDSDDTGYYINPNATSNCSTLQAINFQAKAGHGYGYRFWTSDSYKIYMSSSGNGTWGGRVTGETTSDYNMYFRMTGGTNRGFVFSAGSAGTTKVAGIDAGGIGRFTGSLRAPLFYDNNNTAYYADFGSTGSSIRTAGPVSVGTTSSAVQLTVAGAGGVDGIELQVDTTSSVNSGRMFWTNGTAGQGVAIYNGAGNMYLTTGATPNSTSGGTRMAIYSGNYVTASGSFRAPVFYDSNNTGRYADLSSTGDSIRASGDIVAYYSDDRLKDRGDNIANALDKVQSLNGFHYTANETAQKFGYKANPQVGVSAQEVEAVLPEVVKDAAIGHGYKTVDYAKLVPLLIEAIKELKAEVETLKKG
jgi:hypothetical protein